MAVPNTKNGFVQGSVVRIKLENFMTYSNLEFFPGPNMNVIVGPNGTGKSTIMCAICLGLGGKPILIGRAGNIGDYVKHGYQKANIFVELCVVRGENCVIGREITKTGSSFTINGKAARANEVERRVLQFNIQLSNLCQFLPQDRVVEFVKMTQQELLENTEKAAGHVGMFEDHCKLKDWHTKSKELETACERLKEDLDKESQRKKRLEEQVKNFRDHEDILEKIGLLEKKKCWMQYSKARQQYLDLKEEKAVMSRELTELHTKLKPLQQQLEELKTSLEECNTRTQQVMLSIRKDGPATSDKLKEMKKIDEKASDIISAFNGAVKMEEERHVRLDELRKQLQSLEEELSNLETDSDSIANALGNISREMQQVSSRQTSVAEDQAKRKREERGLVDDLNGVKHELNRLQDVQRQKLELLHQTDRGAYNAVLWLRENQNKFKKTIHEPLMMVVNVRNPKWAKYLEAKIPFKDLLAFVCEDADDLELFMSILRDQQKLRINVVKAPSMASADFIPDQPIENFQ